MAILSPVTTTIRDLYLLHSFSASDERGAFVKDYSEEALREQGIDFALKEVFYTYSKPGVIRAIHFQRERQQGKLVRCVKGRIYDVIVDLREGAETFGKWEAFVLSEKNHQELLIPGGCGHGYLVIEESIVSYKCDERFHAEYDDGIRWDDPDIGIEWPLSSVEERILSDKDRNLQSFQTFKERYGGLR
jgi:dTDP-4-dehydrorhamnose 3,5-epimerase